MRRIPASRPRQDSTQNTRAVRFCLNDEGNYAHRISQCPIRARPGKYANMLYQDAILKFYLEGVYPIYALKLCQQCPENNGEDIASRIAPI